MKKGKLKVVTLNIFIVSLLIVIGLFSSITIRSMMKTSNSIVNESIPVSIAVNTLLTDLINQETDIRSYMISKDIKFLQPNNLGKVEIQKNLGLIRTYVRSHTVKLYTLLVQRTISQIDIMQNYFEEQIALVEMGKVQESLDRIDNGTQEMDKFRQMNLEIMDLVSQITNEAWVESNRRGFQVQFINFFAGLLAIAIGIASGVMYKRSRKAEQVLRESEEKFRLLAENLEQQNEVSIPQQLELEETLEKLKKS